MLGRYAHTRVGRRTSHCQDCSRVSIWQPCVQRGLIIIPMVETTDALTSKHAFSNAPYYYMFLYRYAHPSMGRRTSYRRRILTASKHKRDSICGRVITQLTNIPQLLI